MLKQKPTGPHKQRQDRISFLTIVLTILLSHPLIAGERTWVTQYDHAVSEAHKSSKPILIDCFADWCVWCHRLDAEVYSDPDFQKVLEGFVPLRINVEDQAEGTRLARLYGVDSLPTLLVINADGMLLNRIGGFAPAKELAEDITMIQGLLRLERLNPADWETMQTLGEEYLLRDMNREAETRFRKILESPTVSDQQKESVYFSLALTLYYQEKLPEAQEFLEGYVQKYPDGKSLEDVFLLQSQVYLEMDKKADAKQQLQQLLVRFPESRNRKRVEDTLRLIGEL